jgi:hypothetical protein
VGDVQSGEQSRTKAPVPDAAPRATPDGAETLEHQYGSPAAATEAAQSLLRDAAWHPSSVEVTALDLGGSAWLRDDGTWLVTGRATATNLVGERTEQLWECQIRYQGDGRWECLHLGIY